MSKPLIEFSIHLSIQVFMIIVVKVEAKTDHEDPEVNSFLSFDRFEYGFDLRLGLVFVDLDPRLWDVESSRVRQLLLDILGILFG